MSLAAILLWGIDNRYVFEGFMGHAVHIIAVSDYKDSQIDID